MENHKSEFSTKMKKPPVENTIDKIDTIAPVNKILEDLAQRNDKAFLYYVEELRQCKRVSHYTQHQEITGHPLSAFPDDWDGGLNSGYFEQFKYKSFTPKIITPMRHFDKKDPVTELMQKKLEWRKKHSVLDNYNNSTRKVIEKKCEILNEDVMYCPKVLLDIAAHLDSEPEPYFSLKSSYNWFYAGNGNLQLVYVDWSHYLLHSEFNTLYLSQFSKNDLTINTEPAATFHCASNIFETICSTENIVTLRTKCKIYILKISSGENINIEIVQTMESDLPYTSISFDGYHKNILYATTLDSHVIMVNLNRLTKKTVKLKSKATSLVNNWHTVVGTERPYFTHISQKSITVYDKRTNRPTHTWDTLNRITDDNNCDEITAVKQYQDSNMYIATDHHIFLIDLRHNQSKIKPVQRWTHGMSNVPVYISMCNFEFNKEILCLSSQWCEDSCVLSNYNLSIVKQFKGVSMVYRPPSILGTLNEARENLLCCDLNNPIDSRLCTAITGNLIFEQGENYAVFTQNSLGDIACHTLFPKYMESFLEDDSATKLDEWSKDYKLDKNPYVVSKIADFSKVWKCLKKVPEDYRVGEGAHCFRTSSEVNEKGIIDIFENEDLDTGLLDVWVANNGQTKINTTTQSTILDDTQNSLSMKLIYDTESE